MLSANAESFAWIIRTLVSCRQEADRLQLADLSQIINMAVLQTALDWEGTEPSREKTGSLEGLLRLKMKLAYSERTDNILVMNTRVAEG